NFVANITDPKAQTIVTYIYAFGEAVISQIVFYDGPSPPEVQASPSSATTRAIFNTVSVLDYPVSLLKAIANESVFWGQSLTQSSVWLVTYSVEPFLPSIFSHSTIPSAYPPSRKRGTLSIEHLFYMDRSHFGRKPFNKPLDVADAALYGNYAIFDTPLSNIYGKNVPRLQALQDAVDPTNVMGLAGGFKF
ncbi:hypothetical protein DFH29DRAFT_1007238, partial [Suillus ampliporus]